MGYRCDLCDEPQKARTPCNLTPVEHREQTYRNMIKKNGKPTGQWKTSKGSEIVKELKLCHKCARKVNALQTKEELS